MPPLAQKIDVSLAALDALYAQHGPARIAAAWTGGKDSTVALHLWQQVVRRRGGLVRALSVDTGLKFPEIVSFRDHWAREWDLDLTVARPLPELRSYPVAVDKVSCCRDLKVRPLQRAVEERGVRVLITGLRRDEHPSRAGREPLEPRTCESGWEYVQSNPLLEWTEMDIWAYLTGRNLPFCELYGQGYRSLGCVPCTTASGASERSGRAADKESQLENLRSLGYF